MTAPPERLYPPSIAHQSKMPHSYSLRSRTQKAEQPPAERRQGSAEHTQRATQLMARMEHWMVLLTAKPPVLTKTHMRQLKAELAEAAALCDLVGMRIDF